MIKKLGLDRPLQIRMTSQFTQPSHSNMDCLESDANLRQDCFSIGANLSYNQIIFIWVQTSPHNKLTIRLNTIENTQLSLLLTMNTNMRPMRIQTSLISE